MRVKPRAWGTSLPEYTPASGLSFAISQPAWASSSVFAAIAYVARAPSLAPVVGAGRPGTVRTIGFPRGHWSGTAPFWNHERTAFAAQPDGSAVVVL